MIYLLFNVYWFLLILKSALLPHACTQSPDVIAYLPIDYTTSWMSLCTGFAVYNQVKKNLTVGECPSVLGQKKHAGHRRVGLFQIVFWLSGKYMQDSSFVHRTRKILERDFYAWNFLNHISFLHSSEGNSLCSVMKS